MTTEAGGQVQAHVHALEGFLLDYLKAGGQDPDKIRQQLRDREREQLDLQLAAAADQTPDLAAAMKKVIELRKMAGQ